MRFQEITQEQYRHIDDLKLFNDFLGVGFNEEENKLSYYLINRNDLIQAIQDKQEELNELLKGLE